MSNPDLKNNFLPQTRLHVPRGSDWGQTCGTDYWLALNPAMDLTGTATAGTLVDELVDGGWTCTSLVNTAGSGSDFGGNVFTPSTAKGPHGGRFAGSYTDPGVPNHILTNASGDLLSSPSIFGDAAHMEMAAWIAGKSSLPRWLVADFWANFTVASAGEVQSAIGFFDVGATVSVEANQYAVIQSDGTNFLLAGHAATFNKGALISAATWHKWRIALQYNGAAGPNIYWYIDGALQSVTPGVGTQDVYPLKFGLHSLTTNRQGLGLTHIFYEW